GRLPDLGHLGLGDGLVDRDDDLVAGLVDVPRNDGDVGGADAAARCRKRGVGARSGGVRRAVRRRRRCVWLEKARCGDEPDGESDQLDRSDDGAWALRSVGHGSSREREHRKWVLVTFPRCERTQYPPRGEPAPATRQSRTPPPRRCEDEPVRRAVAPLLALTVALVLADSAVVTLALPDILVHLQTTVGQVAWVLIAFNLVLGLVVVPTAVVFTRVRPRVLTAAGIAVFAISSAWCALAGSIEVLITARWLQAVGGAIALIGCLELLVAVYGERRGVATWVVAGVVGTATGPVAGGLLTQAFSWQAIFV